MATTQKAAAPKAAKKSEGFTGIRGAFWIIVVCFVAAICIFNFVLGDGANFQGGDNANAPVNMLGTIFKGGYVVPIIHTLLLTVLCLAVERYLALKTAFGKQPLTKFVQNVKVISLDEGKDPDETVRDGGAEAFLKKQKEALPVIEYKLKLCADANDLGSVNGRAKYVQSALKVLKSIENRAEREVYTDIVSKKSGVSVATLSDEAGMIRLPKIEQPKESDEEKVAKTLRASRFVLNRILKGEKFADVNVIKTEWLANDVHKEVFEWAKTMPAHTDIVNSMFSKFGYENEEIGKILDINMKFADTIREADYFNDCVLMLANEHIAKRLERLKEDYNDLSDPEAKRASISEISRLQKILKSKDINDKL